MNFKFGATLQSQRNNKYLKELVIYDHSGKFNGLLAVFSAKVEIGS
ncbi:MAG: hypothetical protein HKN76_20615 [Saprospiraceae bacterium]|nr:hypothetical protein [Saprospiraceae bacterium]